MLEITIAVAHAFEGKERYYVKETRDGYSLEYRQLAYSSSVIAHKNEIPRYELAPHIQRLLDSRKPMRRSELSGLDASDDTLTLNQGRHKKIYRWRGEGDERNGELMGFVEFIQQRIFPNGDRTRNTR